MEARGKEYENRRVSERKRQSERERERVNQLHY